MIDVNVNLSEKNYVLKVDNEDEWGNSSDCILNIDDDLTKDSRFKNTGYTVSKFLSKSKSEDLKNKLLLILCKRLNEHLDINIQPDELLNYHKFLTTEQHLDFVNKLYSKDGCGFKSELYIKDFYKEIDKRVSSLCNVEVQSKSPNKNNFEFWIRIVRPYSYVNCFDNNPPHRDISINRLRNALNMYFPLIGSCEDSSLGIVSESHRWKEFEIKRTKTGAKIDDRIFNVLCVTDTKHRGVNIERPVINNGEFLLFSPYCIHGGAPNFSSYTGMSLEIRFWRKYE